MKEPQTLLTSPAIITGIILCYMVLVVVLLLAELGVPGLSWLRATNEVLILLALFFLPFLFLASSRAIRSVSFKLSGQEIHLELSELRGEVQDEVKRVETIFSGQINTAEQALWPLLAGDDPNREVRWDKKQLIIGSKLDPSQYFWAHFLSVWLEREVPELVCITRVQNGGSLKNFADLKHSWIDVYVDYSGTCCQYFNIDHQRKSTSMIVDELNTFGAGIGVRWLRPLGASENYCLVIKHNLAEEKNIKSIKDLSLVAEDLTFSADPEFLNRRDCYPGLASAYDLAFKRIETCNVTDRYAMLESGAADVFVGYETDPELRFADLTVLKDTDSFFPEYHALPVANANMLQRLEGVQLALEKLAGFLTTEDLIEQVQKIRHRGRQAPIVRQIVEEFLEKKPGRVA